eukprot:m.19327 g.19327  ORF g.19327 m.19327 type:complete len:78 (+) comp5917_c0_seq1:5542-5775(+)
MSSNDTPMAAYVAREVRRKVTHTNAQTAAGDAMTRASSLPLVLAGCLLLLGALWDSHGACAITLGTERQQPESSYFT